MDRLGGQGHDALPGEQPAGGERRRLELGRVKREAQILQVVRERAARADRVVRDEAKRMTVRTQARDRVDRSRKRGSRQRQHTVDVDEQGSHGSSVRPRHGVASRLFWLSRAETRSPRR